MPPVHLNYIAIVVAALINMAIAAMWFSPLLFANAWSSSIKKNVAPNNPSPLYLLALFSALLEAYVLAHFVSYALAMSALDGARVGLWLSIGLVVPILGGIFMFENKGLKWVLIMLGYNALALMSMGAVLASWT